MDSYTGSLLKMRTKLGHPVAYTLPIGADHVELNKWIGSEIEIKFLDNIFCVNCGKKTKKSFFQGFCYPCFLNSPETSECIVRPELCLAHENKGKDVAWEIEHHLQEHAVYLALSSGIKVGVTRSTQIPTQIPTRWIDQGASQAIVLARTPNRYLSGCIEVALKAHISDRTVWQRMLKNEVIELDLGEQKQKMTALLPEPLKKYVTDENEVTTIHYPVTQYPEKVKSLQLEKVPQFKDLLMGIKGQYLLFENQTVFNIRRHSGYEITISKTT